MIPTPCNSPREAVALMTARLRPVGTERVPLATGFGRVLAEAIVTDRPSPAADVSAMDGYAVKAADLRPGLAPVAGEARIGLEPPRLVPGTVMRIVTGAPVPPGADAVLKREDVGEHGNAIVVPDAACAALRPGQNVRHCGENAAAGAAVGGPGCEVGPQVAAGLATFGRARPLVFRRVRVGILVTGDEVLDAADDVDEWQLRDSNGPALRSMFEGKAWIELLPSRRVADDPDMLRSAAGEMLATADLLLLTGGVSMGDRDFVPGVLPGLGVEVVFHKVRQRPGRPVLGAVAGDCRAVLGLPGNPLSVLVTGRLLAAPIAAYLAGLTSCPPPPLVEVADDGRRLDVWWHRPVKLADPGRAEFVESRGSGDIPAATGSDGFVEIPPGEGGGRRVFRAWGLTGPG
jgi:molybdopterin molybdotransferase